MAHIKIDNDQAVHKEVYEDNSKANIERYNDLIKSVAKVSLNNIWGNFILLAVFTAIKDQEQFIEHVEKNGHKFADLKRERVVLNTFVKKAQELCGNDYEALYEAYGKKE